MSGTEQITQEKRAELRKLHADATPGPYGFEAHGDTGSYSVGVIMDEYDDEPVTGLNDDPTLFVVDVVASEVNGYQNAAFYAEAYNNFPQLLNALDAEETRADKLSSQLAKALEVNAADQMEAAIKLFGGIVAAVSGEEMPQDLSVRVWLCPHCGTKHDSKEAAVAHDAICPKHPAVVRAEKAEADNAQLLAERDWLVNRLVCTKSSYDIEPKTKDWPPEEWIKAARCAVADESEAPNAD